jgi:hypothetical protein
MSASELARRVLHWAMSSFVCEWRLLRLSIGVFRRGDLRFRKRNSTTIHELSIPAKKRTLKLSPAAADQTLTPRPRQTHIVRVLKVRIGLWLVAGRANRLNNNRNRPFPMRRRKKLLCRPISWPNNNGVKDCSFPGRGHCSSYSSRATLAIGKCWRKRWLIWIDSWRVQLKTKCRIGM